MQYVYIMIVANIISLILYAYDKLVSKTGNVKLRISEKTLLFFAAIGGIGAFLGMYLFRHKTKHKKFRFIVPITLIINIITLSYLLIYC